MKSVKILFSFLFVLVSILSYSQDLIIKQDNSKIYCKVIKQDILAIYYKQDKDKKVIELSINKSDVFKCFTSTNGLIFENKLVSPLAAIEVKKDSILTVKKDSVKQQKEISDSIKLKKDSVLSLNDSIIIKNKMYVYHGYPRNRQFMLDLMKNNKEAIEEMNIARGNFRLGRFIASLGGVSVGAGLANLIFGNPSAPAELGIGCGLILLALPLQYSYHKHVRKAVKLYNTKLGVVGVNIPRFQLGVASSGIGLCLKF